MEAQNQSFFARLSKSPAFRSLMLFSAFRAVYGTGILIVTYFIATSDNAPIWTSIIFLLFSMVFSRILFKYIIANICFLPFLFRFKTNTHFCCEMSKIHAFWYFFLLRFDSDKCDLTQTLLRHLVKKNGEWSLCCRHCALPALQTPIIPERRGE